MINDVSPIRSQKTSPLRGKSRGGGTGRRGSGGASRNSSKAQTSTPVHETLDDRIKDIITSALMDGPPSSAPPLPNIAPSSDVTPRKEPPVKRARLSKSRKAAASEKDSSVSKPVIKATVSSANDLSKLPPSSSLPMSIPLVSVASAGAPADLHKMLNSVPVKPRSNRARAKDTFSPISRPGSSSSTASAESIRDLAHGDRPGERVYSPRTHSALANDKALLPPPISSRGRKAPSRPGSVPTSTKSSVDAAKANVVEQALRLAQAQAAKNALGSNYMQAMHSMMTQANLLANQKMYENYVMAHGFPPALVNAQLEANSFLYQQQMNGLSKSDDGRFAQPPPLPSPNTNNLSLASAASKHSFPLPLPLTTSSVMSNTGIQRPPNTACLPPVASPSTLMAPFNAHAPPGSGGRVDMSVAPAPVVADMVGSMMDRRPSMPGRTSGSRSI